MIWVMSWPLQMCSVCHANTANFHKECMSNVRKFGTPEVAPFVARRCLPALRNCSPMRFLFSRLFNDACTNEGGRDVPYCNRTKAPCSSFIIRCSGLPRKGIRASRACSLRFARCEDRKR